MRDQEARPAIATSARTHPTIPEMLLDAAHASAFCERKFVALEVILTVGMQEPRRYMAEEPLGRSLSVCDVLLASIFQLFCCAELETRPAIAASARTHPTIPEMLLDAVHASAVCERKFVALEVPLTVGMQVRWHI